MANKRKMLSTLALLAILSACNDDPMTCAGVPLEDIKPEFMQYMFVSDRQEKYSPAFIWDLYDKFVDPLALIYDGHEVKYKVTRSFSGSVSYFVREFDRVRGEPAVVTNDNVEGAFQKIIKEIPFSTRRAVDKNVSIEKDGYKNFLAYFFHTNAEFKSESTLEQLIIGESEWDNVVTYSEKHCVFRIYYQRDVIRWTFGYSHAETMQRDVCAASTFIAAMGFSGAALHLLRQADSGERGYRYYRQFAANIGSDVTYFYNRNLNLRMKPGQPMCEFAQVLAEKYKSGIPIFQYPTH